MFSILKAADLNDLVQGGQLYWAFPFTKGSMMKFIHSGQISGRKVKQAFKLILDTFDIDILYFFKFVWAWKQTWELLVFPFYF